MTPRGQKQAPVRPVTDAERAEILRRHAAGETRNGIAKAIGRSSAVVTRTVHDAGLTFARAPEVIAATVAKQQDNKARRARAVERLYDRVETLQDRLDRDNYRYKHVTGEGLILTVTDEYPPAQDERHLGTAITGYLNSAARLEAIDAGDGASDARSMLGALAEGIRLIAGEDTAGEG